MVAQQSALARDSDFALAPSDVSDAATRYQKFREIEAQYLAHMARHDLLLEWSAEVRATVLEAREHVWAAREARTKFREQVRQFVVGLRLTREPLSAVLRHVRSMIELLERSGAIHADGGSLEAEVLEWAIEEYESAA
ncbi:MAG TPA: hypothetical protein VK636_18570 [Gemmatimonadaceae bacterium]|nr:hypothetical protein [Gemmatimonadaceae bacterium]